MGVDCEKITQKDSHWIIFTHFSLQALGINIYLFLSFKLKILKYHGFDSLFSSLHFY